MNVLFETRHFHSAAPPWMEKSNALYRSDQALATARAPGRRTASYHCLLRSSSKGACAGDTKLVDRLREQPGREFSGLGAGANYAGDYRLTASRGLSWYG